MSQEFALLEREIKFEVRRNPSLGEPSSSPYRFQPTQRSSSSYTPAWIIRDEARLLSQMVERHAKALVDIFTAFDIRVFVEDDQVLISKPLPEGCSPEFVKDVECCIPVIRSLLAKNPSLGIPTLPDPVIPAPVKRGIIPPALDWKTMPEGRARYNAYLADREWALLKVAVHERSGGICERCLYAPGEQVHHLTYIRKYRELLTDLQHLCRPCHEFKSGKRHRDPILDAPSNHQARR